MSNNSSSSSGVSFGGLLTVLFVALKLLDKIDWSWWWVLSPLWIGGGFGLLVILGAWIYAMRKG